MKQQIILLRWWTPKENYDNYYDFLEKYEIKPYKEKFIKWSDTLAKTLWEDFEILEIERPNKDFADYKARKIIFEKYIPYIQDGAIFVGHSLWGSFFLKYFNKNSDLLEKFRKILLVAPASDDTDEELIWKFRPDLSFKNLKNYQDKIVVFASKDDFMVPYKEIELLQEKLPNIDYRIFEDKWHFLQENFTELYEELKI